MGPKGNSMKGLTGFISPRPPRVSQFPFQTGFFVLPRLIKSPYKIYFLNIPYFMRVRKRLDAEKIRKIG